LHTCRRGATWTPCSDREQMAVIIDASGDSK
jgi:hypothetical protein